MHAGYLFIVCYANLSSSMHSSGQFAHSWWGLRHKLTRCLFKFSDANTAPLPDIQKAGDWRQCKEIAWNVLQMPFLDFDLLTLPLQLNSVNCPLICYMMIVYWTPFDLSLTRTHVIAWINLINHWRQWSLSLQFYLNCALNVRVDSDIRSDVATFWK